MMHSTGENRRDFWNYVIIFAVCTFAIEVFYVVIFVVRYKQTKSSVRRKRRARRDCALDSEDEALENEREYPDFWTPFDQSDGGFKMVQIRIDSEEYRFVASTFETTIPPTKKKIQRIERIQNELLWSKYYDCTKRMHDHNDGVTNEMCLFHGTRALNPEDIYKGDAGFDMRFSNQGMWGNGNYFAVKASYSDSGYAYRCADGCSQILMASVLTGHQHTCQPDSSLRKPAVRDDSGPIKRRYDSVSGDTGGSKVFITYENDRAYPSYLITYK